VSPFRRIARHVEQLNLHLVGRALAFSSLVGVVAGGGAILFQVLCQIAQHFFLERLVGYRAEGPAGEQPLFPPTPGPLRIWLLPLAPLIGGLITGWIVQRFAPEAAGHGTDEAVEAFHRRGGLIRGRVPIVKTIASAITLGSGGSGGREGPIAQIGAGFGSFLATSLGLRDRDRRILLASGVGAGVGSIFRAPLAGALFAAEVLYSDPEFESDVIIPAAMASIVAYCVFSLKFGFGALFDTPRFQFRSAVELVPYTVLAVVVAAGAGLFVWMFYRVHDLFGRSRLPRLLRPAVGGLVTGAVGVAVFLAFKNPRALDVLAFGYGSIQQAFLGTLPISLMLAIALGKMLTTSFSIGSGGSGGVFGPSMVIGGMLGGAIGTVAQGLMPTVITQPGAFVAVGMAGFFAAAANTPISTLVMVSEMTGNYQLLLPALWVCSLSYLITRRWTLYRSQVPSRFDSPAHRGAAYVDVLKDLHVRDAVGERPMHTLFEGAPLRDVILAFTESSQHCFPVLDGGGRMTGIVWLHQIRQFLEEEEPSGLVIAHDLMAAPPPVVTLEDDLNAALQRLVSLDAEELPVMASRDDRRPVALLSRRDLMAVYNRRRLERMRPAEERRA
jgi:CIC family chloride channel protein